MSSVEDYNIKELPDGKLVENKKLGLTFTISNDWIIENNNPSVFHTSDMELSEKRSDVLKKGCKVNIYGGYIKTNLDTLEQFINEDFAKLSSVIKIDESLKTELSNHSTLEYKYHVENLQMAYVSVNLPLENKLYKILLSNPIQETDRCKTEFYKFLETVSISPD